MKVFFYKNIEKELGLLNVSVTSNNAKEISSFINTHCSNDHYGTCTPTVMG